MSATPAAVDPRARSWFWWSCQVILQNIFVFWLRYRVRGLEHLPAGAALLLINHQSSLDPLLAAVAFHRPVSYLARHELFALPVIGWILKKTYVMPIKRASAGTESIRICVERLKQGYYVGIFPEGTRSVDGSLGEIKPGFLAIVRRANVPVIPVGIAGALQVFPRGAFFLRPGKVRVVIGPAISADEAMTLSQKGREAELLERVRSDIQDCMRQAEEWRSGSTQQKSIP